MLGYTDVGCGGATVALSGNRLVVLSETSSKPAFEVYDWKTGALVNSRPVAQRPLDFAVAGRLVAYSRTQLHLLDLATGKDVVLASQPGILNRGLAMDARGLVYVVNRWKSSPFAESSGKLVFVPRTVLLAKVGQ